jgi:fatty-acyl-CoA synthase
MTATTPITIDEALKRAAALPSGGFTFVDANQQECVVSWPELERQTRELARGLVALGLRAGDVLGLMTPDPRELVLGFLAAARSGVIPLPLYPPPPLTDGKSALEPATVVLRASRASALLVAAALPEAAQLLEAQVEGLRVVRGLAEVPSAPQLELAPVVAEDTAFLQYTSGSTAAPKGVAVSHRALAANCAGIARELELRAGVDIALSWLPLYHDMGLVGFVLTPLFHGVSCVLMPTAGFLRRPLSWLAAVEKHRATITFCAPFALALVLRALERRWAAHDLSSLRVVGIGAEPIEPELVRGFWSRLAESGLAEQALTTAYGMAEATVAISIKRHRQGLQTSRLGAAARELPSCGAPLAGHELSVRALDGTALSPGAEGEVWFRGPSLSSGYHRDPAQTQQVFAGGWLRTGDLGCLLDGELYVTGRLKDLVILNGRNYAPQPFEATAAAVPGVRPGHVVAFSRPGSQSEELVILLEVSAAPPSDLATRVDKRIAEEHGVLAAHVALLRAGTLPRTSSGKLKRRAARELYLAGGFEDASAERVAEVV